MTDNPARGLEARWRKAQIARVEHARECKPTVASTAATIEDIDGFLDAGVDLAQQIVSDLGGVLSLRDEEVARVWLAAICGVADVLNQAVHTRMIPNHPHLLGEIDDVLAQAASAALLVLHGPVPPSTPKAEPVLVNCPGCGARLFGEIADRGACLSCFPVVPDAE